MIDVLKEAKSLMDKAESYKVQAEKLKNPKKLDDAVRILGDAKKMLIEALHLAEGKGDVYDSFQKSVIHEFAVQIADCCGRAGGIYKRMNQLGKAVEMYDEGDGYETNPLYAIENSYNQVNSIVLRILNGENIPGLSDRIKKVMAVIEEQVKGPRRRDIWAWADLGLLNLLNLSVDGALLAYTEFRNNGALKKHYDSTISVLVDLKKPVTDSEIKGSLTAGINFLVDQKNNASV